MLSGRTANYTTKQSEAILACFSHRKGEYITAAQIEQYLCSSGKAVSRPTIYRRIEKLVSEGILRRYVFDGDSCACFYYPDQPEKAPDTCHLKCEICGGIFELECEEIKRTLRHISQNHSFQVNDSKTVFYGKCERCLHSI